MDRFAEMRVFARVAALGSFSRAAAELGLSKSAVSKRVATLEARLGARLIARTTRRLHLTEVGAAFAEACQRLLAELDEAEAAARRLHAEPRGRLRVTAPVSFGHAHLAPALPAFLERLPEVTVDLVLNDRTVDLIEEGYDVAVRVGGLAESSLIARRLAPSRRVVCAAPAYLAARGRPRTPEDLAAHECVLYAHELSGATWRFEGAGGARSVRIEGRLRIDNGDGLRAAAVAGAGIVMMPTFIVGADLAAGRLVPVLTDWALPERAIYAVYPPHRQVSAKLRAFVDFLAERFGPRPYWDEALPPPTSSS